MEGSASREQALKAYVNLPLAFVENRGQTDTRVRYYAQGSRHTFYVTPEEVVLSFVKGSEASSEARGSASRLRGSSASHIPASAAAFIDTGLSYSTFLGGGES